MGKSIKYRVVLVCLILAISSIVIFAETPILDYREVEPPIEGIEKPTAGMKVRVEHQDGTVSEQWVTDNNYHEALEAYVGDKVIVTDWSKAQKSLKTWDFQIYDGVQEYLYQPKATQGAVIKTFTLEHEGEYQIYMCVEDIQTVGGYQNWSANGSHRAKKLLSNGQLYYLYYLRQDIKVQIEKPPTEPDAIYLDAKMGGPSQVDKGDTFILTNESTINGVLWSEFLKQNPGWRVESVRWFYKKPYDPKVKLKSISFEQIEVEIGNGATNFLMLINVIPPDDFTGKFELLYPKDSKDLEDYIELK